MVPTAGGVGGGGARGRRFPAYGPVEAGLGFGLFFYVATRATPAIVEVASGILGVRPPLVGLGLAGFIWFVLAVTVLDQTRRQLVALGVLDGDLDSSLWAWLVPDGLSAPVQAVLVIVGGAIAAVTFDTAVEAAVDFVHVAAALDALALLTRPFLVLVVFFVAFGIATHALDRLLVDATRSLFDG